MQGCSHDSTQSLLKFHQLGNERDIRTQGIYMCDHQFYALIPLRESESVERNANVTHIHAIEDALRYTLRYLCLKF